MSTGQITQKDIIERAAIEWGREYAAYVEIALQANGTFIDSIKELKKVNLDYTRTTSNTSYIELKNQERLATLKATEAIKIKTAADEAAERVKKRMIETEAAEKRAIIDVEKAQEQLNRVKERGKKLTIEERVQNEVNNRALKQQARENLGLVAAYERLNRQRTESKKRLLDLLSSQNANSRAVKEAQKEFDALDRRVRKADQAVGDFGKSVGNYKTALSGLNNLIGAFGVGLGLQLFADIAKDIFQTTKELQQLDLALQQVTGTQEKYGAEQLFLNDIAQKYGLEIKSLTKTYTQFYVAAKDKLAGDQIQAIFESISKSGAAMGLSIEAQERAFNALNQMLSKGTVQAEELKGQLGDALPGAFGIMAKAMGVSERQLQKMLKDGLVPATEALPKFAKELEKAYGVENVNNINTLAAAQNRLSNTWTQFVRTLSEGNTALGKSFNLTLNAMNLTLAAAEKLFRSDAQQRQIDLSKIYTKELERQNKEYDKMSKSDALKEAEIRYESSSKKANELAKQINNIVAANEVLRKNQGDEKYIEKREKEIRALKDQRQQIIAVRDAAKSLIDLQNNQSSNVDEAALEKARKERLKRLKELRQAEFDLEKQRLEQAIKLNQEILADEDSSGAFKVQAVANIEQKKMRLAELTKNFLLKNEELTANERTKILEDYAFQVDEIERKSLDDRFRLAKVDLRQFARDLETKKSQNNIAQNEELLAEEKRYSELQTIQGRSQQQIEADETEHQRRLFEINKKYLLQGLQLQIDNIQAQLDYNDTLPEAERISAQERLKIEEKLAEARLALQKESNEKYVENDLEKQRQLLQQEQQRLEEIFRLTQELTQGLTDLTNALFDRRIAAIDEDIRANEAYYDRQIELAGNDARQRDFLEQEKEKKRIENEKRRRKAERDAAIFNKVMAVAQIGIDLAKTLMSIQLAAAMINATPAGALSLGALGAAYTALYTPIAIGSAALQTATVLATALPKYKDGREKGKDEFAIVGDGGVREVITDAFGQNPRLTSNKPEITHLNEGDRVFKSEDAYRKFLNDQLKNSYFKDKQKSQELMLFVENGFEDKNIVSEIRQLRKVLSTKKQEKSNSSDLNHELWKIAQKSLK